MESGRSVLWIEVCHGLLLLGLYSLLVPLRLLEPWALLFGGLFMAVNFFLLGFGIRWALAPFAAKGRVRLGVCLLVLKLMLFLGLISLLFFRMPIDAPSFAVGVSSLLLAIVVERSLWAWRGGG